MTKLIAMTGAALALVLLAGDSARAETWQRNWTGPYGVDRSATVQLRSRMDAGTTCTRPGRTAPPGPAPAELGRGPYRGYSYRSVTGPAGNSYAVGRAWRRY